MTDVRVGEWLVDVSAPLGSGHFARVLPARRARANPAGMVERRAVKIYHTRGSAAQQRSALAEIRVQEELLGCPHAVAYVDAFVAEEGEFAGCLIQVMELGDRSLADHLDAEGPLRSGDAAAVLAGIAVALEHVHARGWVHADLKPGNIVRCRELWKIADFNVTSALIGTSAFDLGGTHSYMSPQRLAAPDGARRRVRPEDDMWALGVILGQCLLGELPSAVRESREGEAVALAAAILDRLTHSDVDDQLVLLARELMAPEARLRPTAPVAARRLRDLAATAAVESTRRWARPVCTAVAQAGPLAEVFAADDRGLFHRWYVEHAWDEWTPMQAPAPAVALAAGAPAAFHERLWLLDHDGRLWRREVKVDAQTFVPIRPWSAWEADPGPERAARLVDIAASSAPWTLHRLYAVDAEGAGWMRSAVGREWLRLPGAPERLVAIRPALSGSGYAAIDADGAVWVCPGPIDRHRHRLPLTDRVHAVVLLPDEAALVLTDEGLAFHNLNLFSTAVAAPPPGRHTHLSGMARLPHLIEVVLGDDEGRLWHTWAVRSESGRWNWHPEWPEFRPAGRP